MSKRVGVVGLGAMGKPMAMTLRRSGFDVLGVDLAEENRAVAERAGIEVFDSLPPLLERVDTLVLSLPNAQAVENVVEGRGGVLERGREGLLLIDTTTSNPDTTLRLASRLRARGMGMIDAPVSGGPAGAARGGLTVLLGGEDEDLERAASVLAALGERCIRVGPVGAGHVAKIANNLLCAAHLVTNAEVVRLAERAGVDAASVIEAVSAGSGRSGVSEVNFPDWILSGRFDSGFTMKLMRKDVRLAADLARELGLALPVLEAVVRIWSESAASVGDGEDFNRIVPYVMGASDSDGGVIQ